MKKLLTSLLIGASLLTPIQAEAKSPINWQLDDECVKSEHKSKRVLCLELVVRNTPENFYRVINNARNNDKIVYLNLGDDLKNRDTRQSSEFMYENAQFRLADVWENDRLYLTNSGDVYWCHSTNGGDCFLYEAYALDVLSHANLGFGEDWISYHNIEEVEGQCALVHTHSTKYETKRTVSAITRWTGSC